MTDRIRLGDFDLNWATAELRGQGRRSVLPELSLSVLRVLVDHAPDLVSAERLARDAWGQRVVSEDTLAQRIKLLRQAFGESAQDARVILTVRGKGYRLGVPVAQGGGLRLPGRPFLIGGAALALGLAGFGAVAFFRAPPPESARLSEQTPAEADLLLMRARSQMALHRPQETLRAVALLREARAAAPDRADIATALSVALSTEVTKFSNDPDLVTEAETLARWATEQDPANSGAWSALGYALDGQGRVSEALAAYQQAYLLNPDDVYAMSSAAYLLGVRGRLYDALALDMRALQAGGGPIYTELQIAAALNLLGERALSDLWLERALRLNPDHPVILRGAVELDLSRGEDARAADRLAAFPADDMTPDLITQTGWIALRRGDVAGARASFEASGAGWERAILAAADAGAAGPPDYGRPGDTWPAGRVRAAEMAAAAGDAASAFSRLNEAVDLGWRDWDALEHSPVLPVLHADPRWRALGARIEREIAAQRALVDADAELRALLDSVAQ